MSYEFNGTTQYLQNTSTPITAPPFTISAWMNTDRIDGGSQTVMAIMNDGSAGDWFRFYGYSGGTIFIIMDARDSTAVFAATTTQFSADTWHHVAGQNSSTTARAAWLDGGGKGTNSELRTPDGINAMSIGRMGDSTPGGYFDGEIAEVGLWNIALTDAEILLLSKGFSPLFVRPQNLVCYWPLIRNANDIVGGYNMTAYNTPTITPHPKIIRPAG